MEFITGETADYYADTNSLKVDIQDKYNSRRSMSWNEAAMLLRALYQQELDGFSHEPAPVSYTHLKAAGIRPPKRGAGSKAE